MSYLPSPVLYLALVPGLVCSLLAIWNLRRISYCKWRTCTRPENKARLYPPLFSGNVYATLSRRCSDIGLDHRTETLQYQLESITGTTNIPRREREGDRTWSFMTLLTYTVQVSYKETYGVYLLFSKNFNSGKTNIAMSSVQSVLCCQMKCWTTTITVYARWVRVHLPLQMQNI